MSVNTKLNKLKKDDLVAICSSKKVEIPASAKTKPNIIAFMVAYDKWDSPLDTIVDQYMGGSAPEPAPAKAESKAAIPAPTKAEPIAATPTPVKPEVKAATPSPAATKPEVKVAAPAPSINIDDIVKQVTPKVLAEVLKQLPAQTSKPSTSITTSSAPSIKMDEIVKEVMFQLSLKTPASPQPGSATPSQPQKPAGGADPAAFESLTKRVNDLASTVQQLKQNPSPSALPPKPAGADVAALDNLKKQVNDINSTVQQLKQSTSQPAKPSGGPDVVAFDNIKKQINDLSSAVQQLKQSHSQPAQPQKPVSSADTPALDNLTKRMNQLESLVKSDVAGMRNNLESIKQDIKSKLPVQASTTAKPIETKEAKSEIKVMAEIMEAIPPEPTHLTDVYEFLENISQVKFQEMLKFLLMMGLVEGEEADDDLKIELADGSIVGQVKRK